MRQLDSKIRQAIADNDNQWVDIAKELAEELPGDKERQLRNLQAAAERSDSWKALTLFIRYQAARGELNPKWVEKSIEKLSELEKSARSMTASGDPAVQRATHMELVARVIGYTVRWHVWNIKSERETR